MITDQFKRPLQDLRISVIDRCNFRCTYCMPSEKYSHKYQFLEKKEWLAFDEIERVVKAAVALGVRKVRLTGGEPLLRPELPKLVARMNSIDGIEDLALTTNGSLLKQYAGELKKAGLRRLTVSLDTLDDRISRQMNGERGHIQDILEGISAAQEAGFDSIKINTVVQRGVNDHTVLDLVEYCKNKNLVIRFIEYMDVGNQNHWQKQQVVTSDELAGKISARFPLKSVQGNYRGEVAQRYVFSEGKGEIGFISSVSKPFCGDCTRLRLSADGKLYTCLFADVGTDLKGLLRSGAGDGDIRQIIEAVWLKRADRYSELRAALSESERHHHKVEMFQVGG